MIPTTQDYYRILGVNQNSDENEIKKSYYKLCLKWHPDKNKAADAEEKFKEINKAYETLSDPSKRNLYDLQNDFDLINGFKTRSKPRSENFTFNGSTSNADSEQRWSQFNRTAADSSKQSFNTSSNGGSYRKNFYKQYKKYFDSGFFFNIESDEDDDKDYDSDFETESNIDDLINEFNNDSEKTKSKNYRSKSSYNQNSKRSTENNNRKKSKDSSYFSSNSDDSQHRFHPSDPFDLLETFAMYRLFSEMSNRLFEDVNDEEMLINLAKIISSFNFPERKTSNKTTMSTGDNATTGSKFNRETSPPSSTNKYEKSGSDFVYNDEKVKQDSAEYKIPKTTNSDWEFEWLGKSQTKKNESPLPTYVKTDSDSEQSQNNEDEDEIDGFNEEKNHYECSFCNRTLSDRQSMAKHQSICKRLSHNRQKAKNTSFSSNEYDKNDYLNKNAMNESSTSNNSTFSSSTSTSSSSLITECSKCKLSMSTYDYLLHQCVNKSATSQTFKDPVNKTTIGQPIYKPNNAKIQSKLSAFKPVNNRRLDDTTAKPTMPTFTHSDFVFSKIKSSPLNFSSKSSSTSPRRSSRLSNDIENNLKATNRLHSNLTKKPTDNKPNGLNAEPSKSYAATNLSNKYKPPPMSYTASNKIYSPAMHPVYSMNRLSKRNSNSFATFSTRVQPTSGYQSINISNTGLRREKLRTGF